MDEIVVQAFDWKLSPSTSIPIARIENDLWFSAGSLTKLFTTTRQNISLHILDLKQAGMVIDEKPLWVSQKEGSRQVQRKIKHYSFDVAHAIAIRSRNYEFASQLVGLARSKGISKEEYKISPKKERDFAALLIGILSGISEIIPQYHVGRYYIDFYLPNEHIAIEYDEKHHEKSHSQGKDNAREKYISEILSAKFIRVKEGAEIPGINRILHTILHAGESNT